MPAPRPLSFIITQAVGVICFPSSFLRLFIIYLFLHCILPVSLSLSLSLSLILKGKASSYTESQERITSRGERERAGGTKKENK